MPPGADAAWALPRVTGFRDGAAAAVAAVPFGCPLLICRRMPPVLPRAPAGLPVLAVNMLSTAEPERPAGRNHQSRSHRAGGREVGRIYGVDAAFTLLGRHGWDIHVL